MKLLAITLSLLVIMLAGCETTEMVSEKEEALAISSIDSQRYFDNQITHLIDQLISIEDFDYQSKATAFTTIVWVDTLTHQRAHGSKWNLGQHLSSSLKTEWVQKGGNAIEHKSANALSISDSATYYLTRQLDELSKRIDVQYVLAGTMLEIKGNIAVNIEIIDIEIGRASCRERVCMFV